MIITGGTNVYPAEDRSGPARPSESARRGVIGVPDPDWGESIVGGRAAEGRASRPTTTDRRARRVLLASGSRATSVRGGWEFRDDLPRTEAGKLYKRTIRDEYIAAHQQAHP